LRNGHIIVTITGLTTTWPLGLLFIVGFIAGSVWTVSREGRRAA
jgi:hypothetical protein